MAARIQRSKCERLGGSGCLERGARAVWRQAVLWASGVTHLGLELVLLLRLLDGHGERLQILKLSGAVHRLQVGVWRGQGIRIQSLESHRAAHLRRCMLWLRMHKRTPRNHPTTTEARQQELQQVNSNDGSDKLVIQMKRLRSFVYTRSALSGLLRNTAWWPDQAIRVR